MSTALSENSVIETKPGRSAYVLLGAVFLVDAAVFMDRAVLAVLLPRIEQRFDLTDTAAGLLAGAFTVSYCVTLPAVGWLADRAPRTLVLGYGIGIWSLTSLATGLAQDWHQLLAARCLTGIGEATCAPLGPALLADAFPRRLRSRALAVLFAASPSAMRWDFSWEGRRTGGSTGAGHSQGRACSAPRARSSP
jgi:MFS family permease